MKRIPLVFVMLGLLIFIPVAHVAAQEPTRTAIELTVPDKVTVGKKTAIRVQVDGKVASLKVRVIPFLEVTKNAREAGIAVANKVMVNRGSAIIPLTIKQPGEYHLIIDSGLDAKQVAVVAEGNDVWMAEGTVGALLQARLLKALRTQKKSAKGKSQEKSFQDAYRVLLEERAKAAAPKSSRTSSPSIRALAAGAIHSNDTLFFKAQWQGPSPLDPADPATPAALSVFQSFPLDGIKVTIRNDATDALVTETYLQDGVCSFTAPTNGFVPKILLGTSFPGITVDGALDTSGAGIGSFVVQDGTNTTYSYQVPTPLDFVGTSAATAVEFVFDRSAAHGGDNIAQLMATFHAVADQVRELKRTIGQNKASNFKVHFPQADDTSFFGADKKLHITAVRSYVWDVIGHEFGHMVQDDSSSIHSQGGNHDGSNQYDYITNATTLHNKQLSNRLALNEGYGSWLGVAFTERSSRYAGKLKWVGDLLYRDWVNLENNSPKFSFGAAAHKGEDTELAIQALLWDLHDANADAYAATGLSDQSALGMKFLFGRFDNKSMESVFDVWRQVLVPSADMTNFTKATGIDGVALRRALAASITFAEFGMAPHLQSPTAETKIDLSAKKGPQIRWKQYATGNAAMDLKSYKIIVYSNDLTETLWSSETLTVGSAPLTSLGDRGYQYELTKIDLTALKTATKDRNDASVVMAILGEATLAPATGHYLSNGVELLLQDYNRAMVAVVDSSGSNNDTDPTYQRVVASKESLRRLVSTADVTADPQKVPDLAASIDFDTSVSVLSNFADPDAVIPTLDAVDSSGGTNIEAGINTAIDLLDTIEANPGIVGNFKDRAGILVFTDGQNNNGDGPVITAIMNAADKGYRVHYGFLSPLVSPAPALLANSLNAEPASGPGDPPPLASRTVRSAAVANGRPTTIEAAILYSGGVFAQIADAGSQIAFIDQVFARGLTNVDGTGNSGGLLVGQANTADQLTENSDMKSYRFTAQKNENVSVRVQTPNFQPNVTVFDRDGNIVALAIGRPGASAVNLALPPLPYAGEYSVRVYAEDERTGVFNVFIDVENLAGEVPVIDSESDLVFSRQTGFLQQTVKIRNATAADIDGFRILVTGLPNGASLMSGAGDGSVAYSTRLAPGASISLVIEYFNPRRVPFTPSLAVIVGAGDPPPQFSKGKPAAGFPAKDGSVVVEFPTLPGSTYYIQYSDDAGKTWTTSLPGMEAHGTRVQWVDAGPPKTRIHPQEAAGRRYRYVKPLSR